MVVIMYAFTDHDVVLQRVSWEPLVYYDRFNGQTQHFFGLSRVKSNQCRPLILVCLCPGHGRDGAYWRFSIPRYQSWDGRDSSINTSDQPRDMMAQ